MWSRIFQANKVRRSENVREFETKKSFVSFLFFHKLEHLFVFHSQLLSSFSFPNHFRSRDLQQICHLNFDLIMQPLLSFLVSWLSLFLTLESPHLFSDASSLTFSRCESIRSFYNYLSIRRFDPLSSSRQRGMQMGPEVESWSQIEMENEKKVERRFIQKWDW